LRFSSSSSDYLNRTPASAGNRKTWTWSAWVKRGLLGGQRALLGVNAANNDTGTTAIEITSDTFRLIGFSTSWRVTTQVFRDPAAWYHFVVACDTTQATAANRIKIYVNGSEITAFSTSNNPTQNADLGVNAASNHMIGADPYGGPVNYFDGYLAEVNFVDGLALTPGYFGQTDTTSGAWQPVAYTGQYGTNGYFLPFTNISSVSALGFDASGLNNNWTTNNISLTAGSTYDSMTDVPTLTSATAANYCVMNPLSKGTTITTASANLNTSMASVAWNSAFGSLGVSSGKWYWESTLLTSSGADAGVGISTNPSGSANSYLGVDANSWAYYGNNGNKRNNDVGAAYGASYTNGDVIGVALDLDAGTLVFYKNNTSQGTAYSGLASNTYFPAVTNNNSSFATNFGQRPFAYTPPTGFVAINAFNL
jgi:hypothetical protein